VPTSYQFRPFAAAGGRASYGGSLTDSYRQVGLNTSWMLKGEKPTDLPIQQALIVNVKTAKALGLTVPQSLFWLAPTRSSKKRMRAGVFVFSLVASRA